MTTLRLGSCPLNKCRDTREAVYFKFWPLWGCFTHHITILRALRWWKSVKTKLKLWPWTLCQERWHRRKCTICHISHVFLILHFTPLVITLQVLWKRSQKYVMIPTMVLRYSPMSQKTSLVCQLWHFSWRGVLYSFRFGIGVKLKH